MGVAGVEEGRAVLVRPGRLVANHVPPHRGNRRLGRHRASRPERAASVAVALRRHVQDGTGL